MEELLKTTARIFIAQGTADQNISVTSFDVLYATLLACGKQVVACRVAGADHGFSFRNQPGREGWKEVFEDIRNWFMDPEHSNPSDRAYKQIKPESTEKNESLLTPARVAPIEAILPQC